ncbi:MAG: hypothetical protein FWD97_07795 [Defluviitaleaceae bacterium]|nr:hypothetical protein [Defluviitaleaceae bacterium]
MVGQKHSVALRFDKATDSKLAELRARLRDLGLLVDKHEGFPHITVAAYEDVDIDQLFQWVESFVIKRSAFEIRFSSIGIFPPSGEYPDTALIFASPAHSRELVSFYHDFHEKFDEFCGGIGWLYSMVFGYPVIHSTIGVVKSDNVQKALDIAFSSLDFGTTKVVAVEVYAYPLELVKRFEL